MSVTATNRHGPSSLTVGLPPGAGTATDERPLLLLPDDMQWSDVPSLRFLAHLAARIDDLPLVLLGALRPGPSS